MICHLVFFLAFLLSETASICLSIAIFLFPILNYETFCQRFYQYVIVFYYLNFEIKIKIYNFCVEVFEKTISRTKMIDHSLERYYNGVCYRLYKIFCAGTAASSARLKLRNCLLTMMLSTNRYKKHSIVFSRSFFNFCRSFKALQYPNQEILTK